MYILFLTSKRNSLIYMDTSIQEIQHQQLILLQPSSYSQLCQQISSQTSSTQLVCYFNQILQFTHKLLDPAFQIFLRKRQFSSTQLNNLFSLKPKSLKSQGCKEVLKICRKLGGKAQKSVHKMMFFIGSKVRSSLNFPYFYSKKFAR